MLIHYQDLCSCYLRAQRVDFTFTAFRFNFTPSTVNCVAKQSTDNFDTFSLPILYPRVSQKLRNVFKPLHQM